jgi:hypothetical protein
MRQALLTFTIFSSLAFGATSLSAQTSFPLSAEPNEYPAPVVGVELAGLMQEGRSAFVPAPEGIFGFAEFVIPLDYALPTEQ